MNPYELKGRGLFVFSDPGGAKPLLALAKIIERNLTEILIISDRKYKFYEMFNLKVENAENIPSQILTTFKPDFVITGTSYTSKIELEYIKFANQFKIPTLSFVDHWTSVVERFQYGDDIIFPQKILVVDERAKLFLIKHKVYPENIIIFGNPYHEYLKKWKPSISKKEFFKKIGILDLNKKIILFAPDPLSNVNGKNTYGFDEIDTTIELQKILNPMLDKYQFILNPHLNQEMSKINKIVDNKIKLLEKGVDVNHLIFYSDLVIGMFSNILTEATIMNKKVIRFFKNSNAIDPMKGEIGKLSFPETLLVNFKQLI